ncbi:acyl-CoA thioesterase II [Acuticoccus sediminis]|uniref:Acyl-CoA thioesterase 2 n=1 Tax=Acuticoccus sediminis TaxID=2184697 RepID=A0A8B2NYB9_9HYPH|nr:acyl-CoA thioesterase II [Acuticoccus sediminis]RAI03125.1 acyl-CoA thioesterase II [Acuticoccus sediminis]
MRAAIEELLTLLDLEPLEHNLFRGRSPQIGWQRVFGGQVIGQSLVAANRTVEGRYCHSLHGYFMRPGDPAVPIIYQVQRLRDGRSFTTRLVNAIQHGEAIFTLLASYQVEETGYEYAFEMPDVPGPDELPAEEELRKLVDERAPEEIKRYFNRPRPIEMRPTDFRHYLTHDKLPPEQYLWIRATDQLPDDVLIHQAALAYMSDMTLLDTSLFPHGQSVLSDEVMSASLDHAMWFHRPFRADDWLLYATDAPSTSGARGFTRGFFFTRDGTLVASTAQEGLIRRRTR